MISVRGLSIESERGSTFVTVGLVESLGVEMGVTPIADGACGVIAVGMRLR